MIREVDLASYLPTFMQSYKEPIAALEAENPEFILVWNGADRILYNHFISTADEYGISRYERMLGIHPTSEDTLESRRSRVQSKWFTSIPYTMKVLLQKLEILCGDTSFTLSNNFTEGYTLTIMTDLELYGQVEELEYIINTMIPENIVIISKNSIPCDIKGAVFFGGGICFTNMFTITDQFRETYRVDGTLSYGGGIVQTEMPTITDQFKETMNINGVAAVGGGIVQTDLIQVTNDFNETARVDGDALVASGVVHVDFIEIKST